MGHANAWDRLGQRRCFGPAGSALPRSGGIGGVASVRRIGGTTSVKGSGHVTAQPDVAGGSDWPTGDWPAGDSRAGARQRQAWRDRRLPPAEQVRPGLWSIPVPWPDSGLRYTLAYLLETRAGVALVDTGWPSEVAWTALEAGIRQAGHDLAEVGYVLVTHAHPDRRSRSG